MTKTAFLFPGQGAQTVGMGQSLADELPAARGLFDEANEVLGYDLADVCFQGPVDRLNMTEHCQPGLLVCSLAALEKLKSEQPDVVASAEFAAGLSLGEYTALVFANAMTFADALRVVQCRGQAMQAASNAVHSSMVSVLGLESDKLEQLCESARRDGEVLQIANYLCPGNLVCSGHTASCQELARQAEAAGAMKVIPLAVAGAFHTSLMHSAVQRLADVLADTQIAKPTLPVLSNVDARPHWDPDEIRRTLVQQVESPVRWEASMRCLIDGGCQQFFELGPGRVLRGLLRRIDRKLSCDNVQ